MSLLGNIILNVYSIIILLIICVHALRLFEKGSLKDQLYMIILYTAIVMLFVDILGRLDGNAYPIYPILNSLGNFVIFLMSPFIPSLWVAYVHLYIFSDEKKTKRLIYPLCAINATYIITLIISQHYGWYYYIDSNNIYHRGEFFIFPALVTMSLLLIAVAIALINHRKLDKKSLLSLVFFSIPPFISIFFSMRYYGISLMLNSVVFSLLVVFLNIQNHSMYTDHLTALNNRKKLDEYLRKKINSSTMKKSFSAILLDINDFKYINDTYGHNIGDQALETAANILKSSLRANDFIARYGGDEFCIILDISDKDNLEAMVSRINKSLDSYNKNECHLYSLGFSMGYAVYDKKLHMGAEDFLEHIDTLMYQQKHKKFNNM